MHLGLIGYGKMGKRVEALAAAHGFARVSVFENLLDPEHQRLEYADLSSVDVFIDFTHPSAVKPHIETVLKAGKPIVIGTTGWYDASGWIENLVQQSGTKALYGSNFSLGVQLFFKLAEQAGLLFGSEAFHTSMHELHHIQKADAPSGTAKTMAMQYLKGANRPASDMETALPHDKAPEAAKLYVTAERNSVVIGEHRIRIGSEYDDIELIHRARSRDAFAGGALKAARWLVSAQPGFYLLENVIEQVVQS